MTLIQTMTHAADASELGWAPGRWPQTFLHLGRHWRYVAPVRDAEGDIQYVTYIADDGEVLRVYND